MAYQPTVALSPEAREKINAAMKARGERGRDYFSTPGVRVVGTDVVKEAGRRVGDFRDVSGGVDTEGPTRYARTPEGRMAASAALLPDTLAARSRAAAKNSHDDDMDLALNLFMSRDERRRAADTAAFEDLRSFEDLLSKAESNADPKQRAEKHEAETRFRRRLLTPERELEQPPGAHVPVVVDYPWPIRDTTTANVAIKKAAPPSESPAEGGPSDGALSRVGRFVEAATRRADPKQRLKDPAKFAPPADYEVEEHGAGIGYEYGAQASANVANVLRGVPNAVRSVLGLASRFGEWSTVSREVAQPLMRAYERFVGKQHYTTYTGARIPEFSALDALSGKVSADTLVDALPGVLSETAVGAYMGSKALGPYAGNIKRAAGTKARALGGKIYAPPRTAAPLPGELPLGNYIPPRGLAKWFYRRPAFQRSVPHTTATRRFGDLYQPDLLSSKASLVKQAPRKAPPVGNARFEKAADSFKPNPRAKLGKDDLKRIKKLRAKGLIK